MSNITRRGVTLGLLSATQFLASCGNGVGTSAAATIDAKVDATLEYLYTNHPDSVELTEKSAGQLIMPLITSGGIIIGGGYGRGALRVDEASVDYYSAAMGSFGLQIGLQRFAHVLFFMTEAALDDFRHASGWVAGAELGYAFSDQGGNWGADTTTTTSSVIALVFGQTGALIGASVEGLKYTRIIP
ncbi:MAG: YSC84-related protein [Roseovarius sp.]|nr:YSC84-related protein [Roseovarius sp.]MCY4208814.1 YSC84-related protein [Roseovarius sp.]MCY4291503.1 YSC84-related protein [Roseovarius sp.]MCY4315227.1 YSC84-related protein [Roseovarius sp.]